jgi:hypothetical protein
LHETQSSGEAARYLMVAVEFTTLRDLLLHYAARRGWRTQRRIAVCCGLDEAAFSRFLDGKQDIGAVPTFDLFRAVRLPVERYPLAFELLGRAQEEARWLRGGRSLWKQEALTGRAEEPAATAGAAPSEQPAVAPERIALPSTFAVDAAPSVATPGERAAPEAPVPARPMPPARQPAGGVRPWSRLRRLFRYRHGPGMPGEQRDVNALARMYGIEPGVPGTVTTDAVVGLFQTESFTGAEITRFFGH